MTHTVDALELIRAVEVANSPAKLLSAVAKLSSARLEAGIPTLIQVLGYNNPGAAIAAVEGLVQLGEVAVQPLLEQIDGYNYGARSWAVRALAEIGDPRGLEILLTAATEDFSFSVRRGAAKGLGNLRWSQLPGEQIHSAQTQVLKALRLICQDPEWVVRYAAVVGLAGLAAAQPQLLPEILTQFQQMDKTEANLAVRARIWMAIKGLEIERS